MPEDGLGETLTWSATDVLALFSRFRSVLPPLKRTRRGAEYAVACCVVVECDGALSGKLRNLEHYCEQNEKFDHGKKKISVKFGKNYYLQRVVGYDYICSTNIMQTKNI